MMRKMLMGLTLGILLLLFTTPAWAADFSLSISIGGSMNTFDIVGQISAAVDFDDTFGIEVGASTYPAYIAGAYIQAYPDTYLYLETAFGDVETVSYVGFFTIMPLNPNNPDIGRGRIGLGYAISDDISTTYIDCGFSLNMSDNTAFFIMTRIFILYGTDIGVSMGLTLYL